MSKTNLIVQLGPGSTQGNIEQLGLSRDDHPSLTSKLEVRSNSSGIDLADELARGVPDVDTIAATGINTALGIGMNT